MKQSEIKDLSTADLQDKLVELRKSYAELQMAHAIQPLDNPLQLRTSRRTIARVSTELTKREL
ncbi:50S ribosomal protein L29 [Pseudofulvibacter geojedonensis]|uniref:Large ribosomal subunit protein uL29 n=1 Tax=Pseudofulvibacter geojedonensis TaxID=1123758 RepID=A0ABW3I4T7_9FLAO